MKTKTSLKTVLVAGFMYMLDQSFVIVIFYMFFLMCYAVIIIILEKICFPIKRKQGVNDCFKLLISPVFTTVASRLKSEQKEKEK